MTTGMGEIVQRTRLSRQWLSRLAALGEVPGAKRRPSGRWEFAGSQKLEEWMDRMGRRTRIRRRRRALHQDEADVRRLERTLAKFRASPHTKNAQRRLVELGEQIAAKRAAVSDYMTARQLAKATGRSRRWVTGTAPSIPGAHIMQNQFVFPKSEPLSEWIHRQRQLRELERRMLPGDIRFSRSPIATVVVQTLRYERTMLRELKRLPLSEWPKEEQRAFKKDFRQMVNEVRRAAGLVDQD